MAKAGRVQHWKHGWIPISPEARAYAAGTGPRPVTGTVKPPAKALARAKARQVDWAKRQQAIKVPDDIRSTQVGSYRFTRVDGYPEVLFQEVLEVDKRPPEQYREVAKTVQDVMKPYPRARKDPIIIGWTNELDNETMADTDSRGGFIGHRVRLNPRMWDAPGPVMLQVAEMKATKWGIFAESPDLETFRRSVVTHEIGHVLHMRDEDENKFNGEFTTTTISKGEIDKLADEAVTPKEVGYIRVADDATVGPKGMNYKFGRWQVDSLNHRSAYALSNKYEWFAEAFLDGTINGDKASESGKRAVALARKIFSPEGAS